MKRIIDRPQMSDMGSGFGHIEIEQNAVTLGEALKWLRENQKTWGTVTIYRGSDDFRICRGDGKIAEKSYNHVYYNRTNPLNPRRVALLYYGVRI